MTRKGDRKVARHILALLEENKGYAMRFNEIYKTLLKRDLFHYQADISNNLRFLISQGEVFKVEGSTRGFYGIPSVREDGSKYIIVKGSGVMDETIEIG